MKNIGPGKKNDPEFIENWSECFFDAEFIENWSGVLFQRWKLRPIIVKKNITGVIFQQFEKSLS